MKQQTLEERAEELADRIRSFDNEAARECILEFYPRFERYFRKRGLPPDAAAAQSLTCAERVVREVAAGKYTFRRTGGFVAWVFKIAELEAIGWHRSNKPPPQFEDFKVTHSSVPESFGDSFAEDERRQLVHGAVAKLSPDDQTIIRLRFLDLKMSYDEIGQLLGIQNGAARTRCTRALNRLKMILEADPRIASLLKFHGDKDASLLNSSLD